MPELEGAYSVDLPVPTRVAYEAVLNVSDWARWWVRPVATSLQRGINGKAAVGSIIQVRLDGATFDYLVRKTEAGRKIEMTCTGSYRGPASWTFQPEEGGTRATFRLALEPGGLLGKLLGRRDDAIAESHARVVTTSLERLAAHLAG